MSYLSYKGPEPSRKKDNCDFYFSGRDPAVYTLFRFSQVKPQKDTEDIDVYEIFRRLCQSRR